MYITFFVRCKQTVSLNKNIHDIKIEKPYRTMRIPCHKLFSTNYVYVLGEKQSDIYIRTVQKNKSLYHLFYKIM